MSNTTTTTRGFRVEDVTFKGARHQSEILKEGVSDVEVNEEREPEAPKSLTPEQVKNYFLLSIQGTQDQNKRRVFAQTIKWIDELAEKKKELVALKLKQQKLEECDETPDDIQLDEQE